MTKRLLKDCYPIFLITALFLGHQLTGQGVPAHAGRSPSSITLGREKLPERPRFSWVTRQKPKSHVYAEEVHL